MRKKEKTLKIKANYSSYFDTSIAIKNIYEIQAITANGCNVPFENGSHTIKGGKYLIPISSLADNLDKKGKVTLNLFHDEKIKGTIHLELVIDDNVPQMNRIKNTKDKLFTFAYQAISWNENWDYKKVCSKKALCRYFGVGFDVIYDNRFHIKIDDKEIPKELIYELNNLEKLNKSLLLDDDLIHYLTRGEFQVESATFKPFFEYNKELNINGTTICFKDRNDLKTFLKNRLSIYINHPRIYGINVVDEPAHETIISGLKEIYIALKECAKELGREDFYLYINLLPMSAWTGALAGNKETKDVVKDYKTYLSDYILSLGIDYISYDLYPIKDECGPERQSPYVFENVMLAANIAKENNISLKVVTQTNTISFPNQEIINKRIVSYDDLKFLTNTLLGFGVKDISFFTYHYLNYTSPNEIWQKGDGFLINHNNKRTSLYYSTKQIIKEMHCFYLYCSDFKYQYSYLFSNEEDERYINASRHNVDNIKDKLPFDISKQYPFLITNLSYQNKELFMIQNPHNDKSRNIVSEYEIIFKNEIKNVEIFESGQSRILKTENNRVRICLSSGRAIYMVLENE